MFEKFKDQVDEEFQKLNFKNTDQDGLHEQLSTRLELETKMLTNKIDETQGIFSNRFKSVDEFIAL